jgi:hypothetical protein
MHATNHKLTLGAAKQRPALRALTNTNQKERLDAAQEINLTNKTISSKK